MPDLQTQQVGADIIIVSDNTVIGGQTGATLNVTAGVTDINTKNLGLFRNTLEGLQSWSIDADQLYTEDDGAHLVGANDEVLLELAYTGPPAFVQGLDTLELSLTATPDAVGALTDPLWESNIIAGLEAEISMSGSYFDPEATSGEAYEMLLSAQEARETLEATIIFGNLSLQFDVRPGDWSLDAPGDQTRASIDFTLPSEGTIVNNTTDESLDAGWQGLLDAWFDPSKLLTRVELQEDYDGPRVDGSTYWEGEVWVTGLDVSATFGEPVDVSATLTGDGPLERKQESQAA